MIRGKEKEKLRKDARNAFKSWKHTLLGNHTFLLAVLRNGIFDTRSQQELMIAVLQEQNDLMNSDDDHSPEQDKKELRGKALEAQQKLKDARKLSNKVFIESDLSRQDLQLLKEFSCGLLDKKVKENDNAYGHGRGVRIVTKEEKACFRMSRNTLDAYWAR